MNRERFVGGQQGRRRRRVSQDRVRVHVSRCDRHKRRVSASRRQRRVGRGGHGGLQLTRTGRGVAEKVIFRCGHETPTRGVVWIGTPAPAPTLARLGGACGGRRAGGRGRRRRRRHGWQYRTAAVRRGRACTCPCGTSASWRRGWGCRTPDDDGRQAGSF